MAETAVWKASWTPPFTLTYYVYVITPGCGSTSGCENRRQMNQALSIPDSFLPFVCPSICEAMSSGGAGAWKHSDSDE
jgi:hypothetical protein